MLPHIRPKRSAFFPEHGSFCKVDDWKAGAAIPCATCAYGVTVKNGPNSSAVACVNEDRVYRRKNDL